MGHFKTTKTSKYNRIIILDQELYHNRIIILDQELYQTFLKIAI